MPRSASPIDGSPVVEQTAMGAGLTHEGLLDLRGPPETV